MVSASPIDTLCANFPLTFPIPTPLNSSDVLAVRDAQREEDLLRNPFSFRSWWIAIQSANDSFNARIKTSKEEPGPSALGPLANPLARTALKRLTYLYESALVHFPGSFKLWKAYLQTRMKYVLGPQVVKKRAGGKKKFPDMKDALEEERNDQEEWTGGLDPIIGWEEWKALVATFERALMWLPKVRLDGSSRDFCVIDLQIAVATEAVVDVPFDLQSPPMPNHSLSHARTTYVRPSPAHSSTISTRPHLGTISPMGGT